MGDQPNGGPFIQTWTPPTEPRSLEVNQSRRVGRWPGLVAIWQATGGKLTPRLERPWRWLLYGRQAKTTWFFPSVTMEFTAAPEGTSMFGDLAGWAPAAEEGEVAG
jgi:hypothetical protein